MQASLELKRGVLIACTLSEEQADAAKADMSKSYLLVGLGSDRLWPDYGVVGAVAVLHEDGGCLAEPREVPKSPDPQPDKDSVPRQNATEAAAII